MKNCTFLFALLFPFLTFAQNAPDFTITTSDGSELSLYDDFLNQDKTVLLKFFFTACTPCKQISPFVETLYQEWGGGANDVEFISLSIVSFDDNNDVTQFKNTYGLTFPGAGSDGGAEAACQPYLDGEFGSFGGTPKFAVIAPDGSVNFNPDAAVSGEANRVAVLDAAIAATGAVKPNANPPTINHYAVSGTVFGGNGTVLSTADISIQTSNQGTQNSFSTTNNPFNQTNIEENSDVLVEVNLPNTLAGAGISTFDLVLINNHILGIDEFDEAYQLIAADANNDGSISTFDVILLRQLILDIIQNLPEDRNWLIFEGAPTALSSNPLLGQPIQINQIDKDIEDIEFTLVKIGDVTGDGYE